MFNDSRGAGVHRVPGDAGGGRDLGRAGAGSSANQNLDPSAYPDAITATTAGAIAEAEQFRFDMSDLQPSEFGSTEGQGLWKIFQVANPDDIDGTAQQLETAAAAAYGE